MQLESLCERCPVHYRNILIRELSATCMSQLDTQLPLLPLPPGALPLPPAWQLPPQRCCLMRRRCLPSCKCQATGEQERKRTDLVAKKFRMPCKGVCFAAALIEH
jgi:hypothetical protein